MSENNLERPSYYAILTAEVRYSTAVSSSAKLLYAEITALCNKTGTCWAGNKYFANLYGVQPTRISEWLRQLQAAGFIRTKIIKGSGNKRGIELTTPLLEKQKTYNEKAEDNNNTSNNKSYVELERSLLSLVNEVTGRAFRTLPSRGVKKTLDAFTLDEIRGALTALVKDDWHSEKIKELSIDYLIRSTTIDKFLGVAPKPVDKSKIEADIAEEERRAEEFRRGAK